MIKYSVLAIAYLFPLLAIANQLNIANIFADNMVLQRQQPITIWGTGQPEGEVTISLAGQINTTQVNNNGNWQIKLTKMAAGGPYQMKVSSNQEQIQINNVLVGDVWLASGQSNMEWKVDWQIDNWQQEKLDSNFPNIRFYKMDTKVALSPAQAIEGAGWKVANKEHVGNFSAVAWLFAKHVYRNKNIPVGIIESNVGGTPAEAWTPAKELLNIPSLANKAKDILENQKIWQDRMSKNSANEQKKWRLINDTHAINKLGIQLPDYNDSAWDSIYVPFKQPITDIVWLRKNIELEYQPSSATLFFGDITQGAKIFVNDVQVEEETLQAKTEIIKIPNNLLMKGKNTIALRVVNAWDNRVMVGKKNQVWLNTDRTKIDLSGQWLYSNNIEAKMPKVERVSDWPSGLYNAMIHPLTGLSMKGVIWYQGESNVGRAMEYQALFPTMIQSWRNNWGIGDFPFLFVQLASFLPQKETPAQSQWAELREAQTQTLSVNNTGMAVTIDIGDAEDIHPRNKQEVARRLWLAAKSVAYGSKEKSFGPIFHSLHRKGDSKDSLTLNFKLASHLKVKGDKILGFELAGEDGVYYWANAMLVNQHQVKVFTNKVNKPVSVRYGWADNSPANLYDSQNLPVIPFRYGE